MKGRRRVVNIKNYHMIYNTFYQRPFDIVQKEPPQQNKTFR